MSAPRILVVDDEADLRELLTGGLYLEPTPDVEQRLPDVITRLWTGAIACEAREAVLATLKGLHPRIIAAGLWTVSVLFGYDWLARRFPVACL